MIIHEQRMPKWKMSTEYMTTLYQLRAMVEKEATKLYRLAWRAQAHGCKPETVAAIREEARFLESHSFDAAWMFEWDTKYTTTYMFRC